VELNLGTRCRVKAMRRGPSQNARQAAIVRPAGHLRAAQGGRRTGLRSPETTTWNEAISHPWIEQNVNNEFTLATLAYNITRLKFSRADASLRLQ
jgi:hypothetical protein